MINLGAQACIWRAIMYHLYVRVEFEIQIYVSGEYFYCSMVINCIQIILLVSGLRMCRYA